MSKWIRTLVVGLLLIPATAWGEATPEAQKWLENIVKVYDKAPLKVDLEMTIGAMAGAGGGTVRGNLILKDRTHQRVEMSMDMGGGPQGQSMKVGILSVTDGTTTWNEMDMGAMGKQVIKLALADAEELAQGPGLAPGIGSMDPVSQIENLSKMMDLELKGVEGGRVTLEGKITEEGRASIGNPQVPLEKMTLILDEKTGFPLEMTMGAEEPFITMKLSNLEFIADSELPEGAFDYTPPEGVPVMDGAQLMKMRAAQQGGGGR